jgi:hypothetical protein
MPSINIIKPQWTGVNDFMATELKATTISDNNERKKTTHWIFENKVKRLKKYLKLRDVMTDNYQCDKNGGF